MNIPILFTILYITGVIASTYLAYKLLSKILNIFYKRVVKKTKTIHDDEMMPFIRRLIGIGVWSIAFIQILLYFGVDIKALATIFSIGPIIIALCVKDSIKNILSGLIIMSDRPFREGDIIKVPRYDAGEVLKIGLKRTYILIKENKKSAYLIFNNSSLNKANIINYTYAREKRNQN